MVVIYGGCLTGLGPWRISGVEFFLVIPILAMLAAVVAACCLPFRRLRDGALTAVVVSGGLVLLFVPMLVLGMKLRTLGFYAAAKRAAPLVSAIHTYASERGKPPSALESLVPEYLAELPSGLPPLRILTGEPADRYCRGNPWVLSSDVSTGSLNWDEFIYAPLENYETCGRFERIGNWAYYHE